MRLNVMLAVLQVFVACMPAQAQQALPAPGSSLDAWSHIQQLPIHTSVRIKSDTKTLSCFVDSVNEKQLLCSHSRDGNSKHYEMQRAEIRNIKLSRRSRSAVLGLAFGAAVGAGAGAGIGAAVNGSNTHSYLHTSGGKAAGVGAVLGVVIGSSVGVLVAYSEDFFAGPVVYQR